MADESDNAGTYVPPPPWITRQAREGLQAQEQEIQRTADSLRTNRRLQTGHYDTRGHMIVYYSMGLEGVPQQMANALRQRWQNDNHTEFTVPPAIQGALYYSMREYENTINVVFHPLSDAPRGTEPDIVFATDADPRHGGDAAYPGDGPLVRINREDFATGNHLYNLGTGLHELGHKFGLKHPRGNRQERGVGPAYEGYEEGRLTVMSQDVSFSHGATLLPADIARLQSVYGPSRRAAHSGTVQLRLAPRGPHDHDLRATAIDTPHEVILSAANYDSRIAVIGSGVFLDADERMDFGDDMMAVTPRTPVVGLEGTSQHDSMTASVRRQTTMRGRGGIDSYTVPALPPGLPEHQIFDSGRNWIHVAEGARVAVHYEGEGPHESTLIVDFVIRSSNVVRTADGLSIILMSRTNDQPTVVRLPYNDQQIIENRLRIYDVSTADRYATIPINLSGVSDPAPPASEEEPAIVVTAQRTPSGHHSR